MAFDFPTSPAVDEVYTDTASGAKYRWDGLTWQRKATASAASAGVEEAPIDGTPYSRQDAAWASATAGGGIADAPVDTKQYGRQDAAWTEIAAAAGGAFLPLDGSLPMTGTLTINAADSLNLGMVGATPSDYGYFRMKAEDGTDLYKMLWNSTEVRFEGAALLWSNIRSTFVINFTDTPTVLGIPIVMKTEHDALLARVDALEARLAKAKL